MYSYYVSCRNPLNVFDSIFYLTAEGRKYKRAIDYMHHVSEDVIKRRKKALVRGFTWATLNQGWCKKTVLGAFAGN